MIQKWLECSSLLVLPSKGVPSTGHPLILIGHALWRVIVRSWILHVLPQSIDRIFFAGQSVSFIGCCGYGLVVVIVHHTPGLSEIVLLELDVLNALLLA